MNDAMMTLAILPEISLILLGAVVLSLDLLWIRSENRRALGWVTAAGIGIIIFLSAIFAYPQNSVQIWGGMLRFDQAGFVFRMLFLLGAGITSLFAVEEPNLGRRGEFYFLLLVATLGMSLMASSTDLVMLYLAIETTSIPLYVLAGFWRHDQKSVEAGLKYMLFGAMASALMLYGFTLLYGFSGTTQLFEISRTLKEVPLPAVLVSVVLVLAGFSFKVSAVPFHFWAPDVYEGAPTSVAGFLSTASKAAGFAVLIRVLLSVFPELYTTWTWLLVAASIASMFLGNLLALAQKNIKRLLAYSSISHAGFILMGVATASQMGNTAAVYYLSAYLVTNLAAFGIVAVVGRQIGSNQIGAYAGLSRRSPGLALALLAALLSLAGIPPFAGFMAKLLVLAAAVKAEMAWLAIIGVINSIIALYYYLTVLKVVYLYRSEDEDKPIPVSPSWATALVICIVGIILAGTVLAPLYAWSTGAGVALLGF